MDLESKKAAFLEEVGREAGAEAAEVATRVFGWVFDHGFRDYFAERNVHGEQYWPVLKGVEWEPAPIVMSSVWGQVSLSGEELYRNPPFNVSTKRSELIDRFVRDPAGRADREGHLSTHPVSSATARSRDATDRDVHADGSDDPPQQKVALAPLRPHLQWTGNNPPEDRANHNGYQYSHEQSGDHELDIRPRRTAHPFE
jgi:hypothetical protein